MAETSPEKVGWLFIQQYYSKLNSNPSKLYQFYTKASTLVHGLESEPTEMATGQAQIQARVKQEEFDDCKVVVLNVDCLPSLENGVIIQVLGEMTNRGQFHKFVQTFFLASQPNGYYVLNDILRLLKDSESDAELSEEEEAADQPAKSEVPIPGIPPAQENAQPPQAKKQNSRPSTPAENFGAIGFQAASRTSHAENSESPKPATVPAPAPATSPWAKLVDPTPKVQSKRSESPKEKPTKTKERKVFFSAYLKNVTPEVDQAALQAELERAGEVTHLQIETSKGRAFVDFISQAALDKALAMGSVQAGPVTVVIEERKRKRPQTKND